MRVFPLRDGLITSFVRPQIALKIIPKKMHSEEEKVALLSLTVSIYERCAIIRNANSY